MMPLVGVVLSDLANPVLTIGRLPRCLTRNIAREYCARDVHIPSHELIHEDQDRFRSISQDLDFPLVSKVASHPGTLT